MRLWSIHPKYLDTKGLLALWREGLLAKKVLEGKTKGYTNHPQLIRFKKQSDPIKDINYYLDHVFNESQKRGFNFDFNKIKKIDSDIKKINITSNQIKYEFDHLIKKLLIRDQSLYQKFKTTQNIDPHPLFKIIPGKIEPWEII